jgi:hypothetical protein
MRGQWLTVSRGIPSSLPVLAAITLGACTTYAPVRLATPSDLSGVQTKTMGDVTVSVAILTDDRAQRHFGADLGSRGVQALWMSVLNGAPRRLWLAPFRHEGRQVWVGQVSRDIGIKLSSKSPSLTTHIIDPEVDLTREYLLHSLLAEGFVDRFGFVKGSTRAPSTQPARNLTGDPYFSDGMRLVIMLSPDPVPYARVRSLLWEQSAAPVAEGQTEAAGRRMRPIGSEDREAR